MRTPHQS